MLFGGLTVCRRCCCFGELALKEIAPNLTLRRGPLSWRELLGGRKFAPSAVKVALEKKCLTEFRMQRGVSRFQFHAPPAQLRRPSVVPSIDKENRRGAQEVV